MCFWYKDKMWLSSDIVLKFEEMVRGLSMIARTEINLMEMGVTQNVKFKMNMSVKEVQV